MAGTARRTALSWVRPKLGSENRATTVGTSSGSCRTGMGPRVTDSGAWSPMASVTLAVRQTMLPPGLAMVSLRSSRNSGGMRMETEGLVRPVEIMSVPSARVWPLASVRIHCTLTETVSLGSARVPAICEARPAACGRTPAMKLGGKGCLRTAVGSDSRSFSKASPARSAVLFTWSVVGTVTALTSLNSTSFSSQAKLMTPLSSSEASSSEVRGTREASRGWPGSSLRGELRPIWMRLCSHCRICWTCASDSGVLWTPDMVAISLAVAVNVPSLRPG